MPLPIRPHLRELIRTKNPSQSRLGCLRLDKNESALPLPPELVERFRQAVTDELVMIYPELDAVTAKLARWLGCSPQNIFLAAGSDPAIKALFELFVEPGDAVLLPTPTYQMFSVYSRTFQARSIEAHYGEGLALPMERLLSLIAGNRCKLAVLANPNSPTGTVFSRAEVIAFIEACGRHGTVALVDEAYFHFHADTVVDLIDRHPHLAVTRTFSKAVGLAAVRFGFVAAHEEMIQALNKVRPMYETNGLAARFAEIMLDHMDVIDRNVVAMREGKSFLERALDELGVGHYPTAANFMNVRVGTRERSREIVGRLKEQKVLIGGDFAHPSLADCIRVGLGSRAQMERFIESFIPVWRGAVETR